MASVFRDCERFGHALQRWPEEETMKVPTAVLIAVLFCSCMFFDEAWGNPRVSPAASHRIPTRSGIGNLSRRNGRLTDA